MGGKVATRVGADVAVAPENVPVAMDVTLAGEPDGVETDAEGLVLPLPQAANEMATNATTAARTDQAASGARWGVQ